MLALEMRLLFLSVKCCHTNTLCVEVSIVTNGDELLRGAMRVLDEDLHALNELPMISESSKLPQDARSTTVEASLSSNAPN